MKKQFSLFLILILIAGCSDTVDNSLETINFHKGTEGLTMEIVNNLPPEDIWKNSEFQIGIKLENKGPVEIKSGSITISGLDPRYSFSDEYTKDFSLNARSYDYPEGDQKIISFNVKNTGVPVGSDEYAAAFTARAYYDYGTEASVNVCINPNIYSYINTVDDACEVQDIADTEGQGSPIAVTKVEERISPISENSGSIEIEFKLTLENLGKGEVVDKIKVDEVLLGRQRLKCNLDEIKMEKSKPSNIMCKTTLNGVFNAYTSSLITRLSYDYTQKLDKSLKVLSLTTNKRNN